MFIANLLLSPSLRLVLIAGGLASMVKDYLEKESGLRSNAIAPSVAPKIPVENSRTTPALAPQNVAGRDYVPTDVTPKFLCSLVEGQTSMLAQKIVEVYIGKWMMVSGTVFNTHERTLSVGVTLDSDDGKLVYLTFENTWLEQISVLRKGNRISVVGKISEIEHPGVSMESCEISS